MRPLMPPSEQLVFVRAVDVEHLFPHFGPGLPFHIDRKRLLTDLDTVGDFLEQIRADTLLLRHRCGVARKAAESCATGFQPSEMLPQDSRFIRNSGLRER